ncbi:hypothetical protein [Paraburkholderia hospita]|uniref:hypothetical protein n=1 Tax=Paraburkholderia hospita TaxID=169430 RepID=UPI003ECCA50A
MKTLCGGRKDPNESMRSSAFGAGFVAGEKAAAARADLFRREMAVVLVALGDAIAADERVDMVAWFGVASKVFVGGAPE